MMTDDEKHEKVQAFEREFKALVRKYVPRYPWAPEDMEILYRMQDCTSVFSPFVWGDEEDQA